MRRYFVKNWKRIALPLFLAILYSGIFTLWQLGLMPPGWTWTHF